MAKTLDCLTLTCCYKDGAWGYSIHAQIGTTDLPNLVQGKDHTETYVIKDTETLIDIEAGILAAVNASERL